MKSKSVLPIFTFSVAAFALVADAAIYDAETAEEWFSVDVSALTDSSFNSAPWAAPSSGGTVSVADGVIVLDADIDEELSYTPQSADPGTDGHRVSARILASLHASASDLEPVTGAQASIAAVTVGDSTAWYGWTSSGWTALSGLAPVADAWYDLMIEFKTTPSGKFIRYAVKAAGGASYTYLTSGGDAWLGNGNSSAAAITRLAFSGSGRIGDFGAFGVSPVSSYSVVGDAAGFDFTNRTISVAVGNAKSGAGVRAVVKDSSGATVATTAVVALDGDGTYVLNVDPAAGLVPGARYDFEIQEVEGGASSSTGVGGSFVSAAWSGDTWFAASISGSLPQFVNGAWAVAPGVTNEASYGISGDAVFAVTDSTPGAGRVSRVDTALNYVSFADVDDLGTDESSYSGIVAATNSAAGGAASWRAISSGGSWVALVGCEPQTGVDYILRAEFDFKSATHAVRYLVSSDGGASFTALSAAGGGEWLPLAKSGTGLSEVHASGSGTLASLSANVTDSNVASAGGTGYATLAEALASGETVTLLTNVAWSPSASGTYTIVSGGNTLLLLPADGVKVSADGNTYTVEAGYFEVDVITAASSNRVMYLKDAVANAESGVATTNILLRSVQLSEALNVAAGQKIVLNLATNELYGAAVTVASGGSLEVSGGYVGVSSLPEGVLKGGRTIGSSAFTLPSGYSYVELAEPVAKSARTYTHQVVAESAGEVDGKAAYDVSAGGESAGSIVISTEALTALGVDTASVESIKAGLDASGSNGLPVWQSYVLGLDPKAADSKPFAAPVQNTVPGKLKISLAGVNVPSGSGATVQYSVQTLTSLSDASPSTTDYVDAGTDVELTLDPSGVRYYRVQIKVVPAQ